MEDTASLKSATPKPSIFNYQRFGEFLRALFEDKTHGESLSYRGLAKKVQGVSGQMLHAIAHGKRLPGQTVLSELCRALGLTYTEERFAELLVAYERAESSVEKDHYSAKLKYFRREVSGILLTEDRSAFLKNPRHVAIFEMLDLEDFRPDPEWVSKRLLIPTTPKEVSQIFEFLEAIELVTWENGVLKKNSTDLSVFNSIPAETISGFHRDMMHVADNALETLTKSERSLHGITMSIDPSKLPEARRLIAKFALELGELLNVAPMKDTYHLGIQLFRVTRDVEQEGDLPLNK